VAKKEERFVKIYEQGVMNVLNIYVDQETGVQYLIAQMGGGTGITPLLGSDGKPLLAKAQPQADDPYHQ